MLYLCGGLFVFLYKNMDYNFKEIEAKWQRWWDKQDIYRVSEEAQGQPFYVLDMFPYPSGAGLHMGHPLGYTASDIYARYKRMCGFNVLHPMGFDAFGLPAEQYAIQTGQPPHLTTQRNSDRYRTQLRSLGFSFDWSREVSTADPRYYRWTQWAFIQMFHSYYCRNARRARPIAALAECFAKNGTQGVNAACTAPLVFTEKEWNAWDEGRRQEVLMNYRLAYLGETMVNWCAALGTVLANDEVINGLSERGGHPVEQRKMKQWCLRTSAYAQRLLDGLNEVDWSDSLKETQRNWIGRSQGADVFFRIKDTELQLQIFTTRPDTLFGATFMVIAPESPVVQHITLPECRAAVDAYCAQSRRRTERERIADRTPTGVFTGAFALNPLNGEAIPVWAADYVLAGYGSGAIMAVPAHDSRDYAFARHFGLPITPVIEGCDVSAQSYDAKEGIMCRSGFLNGLPVAEAIPRAIEYVERQGIGRIRVNYRLRDAVFSRQRYWGEPFPVFYKNGIASTLPEDALPLVLPEVDSFAPSPDGEPPLARARHWAWDTQNNKVVATDLIDHHTVFPLEKNTMPGFAGASAYYLRYMDSRNDECLVSAANNRYWRRVNLYVGGMEHATGHLIYSRFWNKFLCDIGVACEDEPYGRMVNQGMIQGRSSFVYRIVDDGRFVSAGLKDAYLTQHLHVDIGLVDGDILDIERFRAWRPDYANAEFILEDGKYVCGWAIEKMSKSMHNVVNPTDVADLYGADALRLYVMFLGPLELSKPWDAGGIEGVHRFLRKLWRLFFDAQGNFAPSDAPLDPAELKTLHRTIKRVRGDIERFSFNTAVSAFMICVNELSERQCGKRAALQPLAALLAPFAPHIAEELWHRLGNQGSVCAAAYPNFDERFIAETSFDYPVSFNGRVRFKKRLPLGISAQEAESAVLADPACAKAMDGRTAKKVIFVEGKIVNVVV